MKTLSQIGTQFRYSEEQTKSANCNSFVVNSLVSRLVVDGSLGITCGTGCAYGFNTIFGWSNTAGGAWQPGSLFSSIPDRSLIGFTNAASSLSQTLTGNSVLANSIYTFSVFVGERSDGISGVYNLSLDTIVGE
jgi:hypothetical protein